MLSLETKCFSCWPEIKLERLCKLLIGDYPVSFLLHSLIPLILEVLRTWFQICCLVQANDILFFGIAIWFQVIQMYHIVVALSDLHQKRGIWSSNGSTIRAWMTDKVMVVGHTTIIVAMKVIQVHTFLALGHSIEHSIRKCTKSLTLWRTHLG